MAYKPQIKKLDYYETGGGGGSLSIGDAIGSANNYRMLSTDGSGNLTDEAWEAEEVNIFGVIPGSRLQSTEVSTLALYSLDASGLGGSETMAFASSSGSAGSFGFSDLDTFNTYLNIGKNTSNVASLIFYPYGTNVGATGALSISTSGMQLGGSGATVGTILDEDNMASDSATALATQQSIKAYVDANSGGGQVDSVVSGTGITVDATDPVNPIVNLSSSSITSLGLADSALQSGDNVSELTNDAAYATTSDLSDYLLLTGGTLTGNIDLHNGYLSTRRATTSNSDSASVYFYTDTTLKYSMGIFRNDDDLRIWKAGSTTDIFRVNYTTEKVHFAGVIADGGTASQIAYLDSNKELKSLSTSTYPSLTELSYVKGVTSSIQNQLQDFGGGILLSNSRAGTALSLFTPASGSASATAYSAGHMLMWGFSGLGVTNIEALQINVTATGLAAGEYVTICVYKALSNGGPGTLLWSENITVGTSTGDRTLSGITGRTRPPKGWLAVLNPSGNSGSVTLSRVLPNVSNDALVNAAGVAYGHLKTGVASPPDLTSEVLTADHTGVPIVRARP